MTPTADYYYPYTYIVKVVNWLYEQWDQIDGHGRPRDAIWVNMKQRPPQNVVSLGPGMYQQIKNLKGFVGLGANIAHPNAKISDAMIDKWCSFGDFHIEEPHMEGDVEVPDPSNPSAVPTSRSVNITALLNRVNARLVAGDLPSVAWVEELKSTSGFDIPAMSIANFRGVRESHIVDSVIEDTFPQA